MRPRKKVLCVNANENQLSVLSFTLEVSGFRALPAVCAESATALFVGQQIDICVISLKLLGKTDGVELIRCLKQIDSHVPMILIASPSDIPNAVYCANAMLAESCGTAELLERIKIMCAHKRGPRKGRHRVPFLVAETVSLPAAVGPSA